MLACALLPAMATAICGPGGRAAGDSCHNYSPGDFACGDHVIVSNPTTFEYELLYMNYS